MKNRWLKATLLCLAWTVVTPSICFLISLAIGESSIDISRSEELDTNGEGNVSLEIVHVVSNSTGGLLLVWLLGVVTVIWFFYFRKREKKA